jgi:hypothetical protein
LIKIIQMRHCVLHSNSENETVRRTNISRQSGATNIAD